MSEVLRFLNWSLGFEQSWPVSVVLDAVASGSARSTQARTIQRWVSLQDGPELIARFAGGAVGVRFRRGSDRRAVQRTLADAPRPLLVKLGWTETGGAVAEGELTLSRCAMPASLEAPPVIVVPEALRQELGVTADALARGLTLETPDGVVLVAQTSLLKDIDETGCDVTLFCDHAFALRCRIEGDPARERLVVTRVEPTPQRVSALRFVTLGDRQLPRIVIGETSVAGTDLACLAAIDHVRLRGWLDYERQRERRDARLFAQRQERPLEYDVVGDVQGDRPTYELKLVAADEERLTGWCDEPALSRPQRSSIAVEVLSLDASNAPPLEGTLVRIARRDARVVVGFKPRDARHVPPTRGRVIACEDRGRERERARRRDALTRIFQGAAACPDLLRWLFEPERVRAARSAPRLKPRPGQRPLNDAQRAAVERVLAGHGLVLVQGPPGTGKTQVIAETVLLLRDRRRRELRAKDGVDAPLRVLVSSVQNDAVANALERLQAEGVEVFRRVGAEEKKATADPTRGGRTLAAQLRKRHAGDPSLSRQEQIERLHDALGALRGRADSVMDDVEVARAFREFVGGQPLDRIPPAMRATLDELTRAAPAETNVSSGARDTSIVASAKHAVPRALPAQLDDGLCVRVEVWIDALESSGGDAQTLAAEHWRRALRRVRSSVKMGQVDPALEVLWERAHAASEGTDTPVSSEATTTGPSRWRQDLADWVSRVSHTLDAERAAHERSDSATLARWIQTLEAQPGRLNELVRRHAPVLAATCQLAAPEADPAEEDFYDLVIVDEAARAGVDVLIPMSQGRQIMLVGDHEQLPPHIEEEIAAQMEQGLREAAPPEESLFRWLWERLPDTHKVALDVQYRMHEDIGRVVSEVFYEPRLTLRHYFAGPRAAERAPCFGLVDENPVVWIDTSHAMRDESVRRHYGVTWPASEENAYEVAILMRLLASVDQQALRRLGDHAADRQCIGVIPFYQRQTAEVRRRLSGCAPELQAMVRCGTVDSFQGMEFPLVMVSCVKSNTDGGVGFLRLPQRVNVALSRAQRQVIVVGDAATVGRDPRSPLGHVLATLRTRPGAIVSSGEVMA